MPRKHFPLEISSSDRVGIFGQPGTGKTKFTQYLCSLAPSDRLMIYDPLDQYGQFGDDNRYVPLDTNPVEEFDEMCKRLIACRNLTFFVEEAQQYLPESHRVGLNTAAMLNRSRNMGIGLVVCAQRIQDISKRFFDLAQIVIFFRCGVTSRSYIATRMGKEVSGVVANLPDRHFLYYELRTDKWNISTLKFPQNRAPTDGAIPASARVEEVRA